MAMNIQVAHYKWNRVVKRWECQRTSAYSVRARVVEAYHNDPFLSLLREQSGVQLQYDPGVDIDPVGEPVV
jgi:hypothetical protein